MHEILLYANFITSTTLLKIKVWSQLNSNQYPYIFKRPAKKKKMQTEF